MKDFGFDNASSVPLAEKMRPKTLSDMVGQSHLLKSGKLLRELIAKKKLTNMILWGPPGSGKTTIARIIANETDADFIELSAVTSGKADINKVVERAKLNARLNEKTILFVDEIHRFNKAQQDAFLPHLEDGTIILIGATTENPSFEIINPLLSRSRILVLEPLSKVDIIKILKEATKKLDITAKSLPQASLDMLAEMSGGDARVALGNLELAHQINPLAITKETIISATQKKTPRYDKNGENHYNLISAFIKSLRGSDANASLYYMARILDGGEDPKFIARRMVIFASEDIGMATTGALNLAVATFSAVEQIGMPECQYALYHCAITLAKCKKSREVPDAIEKATEALLQYADLPVPLHLRNAPSKLMRELGYGKGTEWTSGFKHPKGFLPDKISNLDII
jgi:putative ATPase